MTDPTGAAMVTWMPYFTIKINPSHVSIPAPWILQCGAPKIAKLVYNSK